MAKEHVYVFCYDIESLKVRNRIAKILEQHGCRVQKSVFEVRAEHQKAEAILRLLQNERLPGDSIRMYCITEEGRKRCATAGGAPPPEASEFWLL
jgi:CRISPR-associated protein Cas2